MGCIRIIAPPWSPYAFGPVVMHDMVLRRELGRMETGSEIVIQADAPIELGIAWGRGNTPRVKLRFTGKPGRTYALYWLKADFGAGMGVVEIK